MSSDHLYARPQPLAGADVARTGPPTPPVSAPGARGSLAGLLVLALGVAATAYWLGQDDAAGRILDHPLRSFAALGAVAVLTTGNLLLRWIRWHFLTRTLEVRLKVRDSIGLYFSTLPAILTPLYLGEMLRAVVLARRHPRARQALLWIWFVERLADASMLGLFWLLGTGRLALAALAAAALLALAGVSRRVTGAGRAPTDPVSYPMYAAVLIGLSAASWSLPVLALHGVTSWLGAAAPLGAAASAYAEGTLLGGASGIPLGTGITGATAILSLRAHGVLAPVAAAGVAIVRAGTAWYAVALGLGVLWTWKRRLRALFLARDASYHFDDIAAEYAEQIPAHIRERLLARKVSIMRSRLRASGLGPGARGLDLGCGQGWYACEMAAAGFEMVGVDRSAGQIAKAREHAAACGAAVEFERASGARLDFDDGSFDFVYAINVLHHVTDPVERERTLREVVRVLKPGRSFYVHEMNTRNPAFRFYLAYVFPLIKSIDEGDEVWLRPADLPEVPGAAWAAETDYFNFLPDVLPERLLARLASLERWLEVSPLRHWSAHFLARLTRAPDRGTAGSGGAA